MANRATFCTCTNTVCPYHLQNQDQGCTPCIAGNLRLKEIPNCFFNLVPGSEGRKNDHFSDFAAAVQQSE
ncbi:DUF6485 family protein [Megasphaera vaginalis (ex Srinivasan et al. 2021)]|uniref:Uncharacterized protein n=1 Tax=Megasphaera vaginalis (ex Srinivasan et al. 2021) TaxID=1111454 RepID=U7USW6_9FIRM|nr:DUF6485 family protein [Megasphaera vaginalis (ex Srinivasan et al. 2021)]ERT62425.1 hypothetical protein HMPREF1250_1335 [Megasphaera vaginalis (ex Srinivasan et al. 2021)]